MHILTFVLFVGSTLGAVMSVTDQEFQVQNFFFSIFLYLEDKRQNDQKMHQLMVILVLGCSLAVVTSVTDQEFRVINFNAGEKISNNL